MENQIGDSAGDAGLMVLRTLEAMGPLHGYGIGRRIEQVSQKALQVNQGTIYLCLVRLVQEAMDHGRVGHVRE